MSAILKAGVIGTGVFGGYHAKKYAEMDGIQLMGVYDTHPERCFMMAEQLNVEAYGDLAALKAGKSVYVEKPLAANLDDADKLLAAAATAGLVLACGHQERVVFR